MGEGVVDCSASPTRMRAAPRAGSARESRKSTAAALAATKKKSSAGRPQSQQRGAERDFPLRAGCLFFESVLRRPACNSTT